MTTLTQPEVLLRCGDFAAIPGLGVTLFAPPASVTESTLAVAWTKPENANDVAEYQVYIDGQPFGVCKCTDYTAYGLASAREYDVLVRAVSANGDILHESNPITIQTKAQSQRVDVTSFGAVGDGATLNTAAIQSAIDACPFGGTIHVPAGVFLTGALFLKSDMTLYLSQGAVILGSVDVADYPIIECRFEGNHRECYASLINGGRLGGETLKNITIDGPGHIDASGVQLRRNEVADAKAKLGRAVCFRNARNIYLHGITVKQSPFWCVHLIYCQDVTVNDVRIRSRYDDNGNVYSDVCNGDGLNPDSCSNVHIFHTTIGSQDDCIAVKSGRDAEGRAVGIPSQYIRITNCRFTSGFGVALGSEMSGGISDVFVQDCQFENVYSVASIKGPRGRGAYIRDAVFDSIAFSNTSNEHRDCQWFRGAIYIDQYYGHVHFDPNALDPIDQPAAKISNITFRNISLMTTAGTAIYLVGLPESPLEDIRFENVTASGLNGMVVQNTKRLVLENSSVSLIPAR